ncbi:MAG: tetratricopeptide repeat protein [Thermoguttaceae bacterium]|jgi:Flp pilus assembly protein TadD
MRRNLAISIGLVLLVLVAYWQVAGADFITLDDPEYVTDNAHVHNGLTWEGVKWAFSLKSQSYYWHPLTWLSLMLDHRLFGASAAGYHLMNLGLHAADTVLLFLVLSAMTRAAWPSALAAALFAVHPLHVEAVAWVTSRKDVLSTLFGLAAIAAYVAYARRPGWTRYAIVVLCFALGLLAKPMLVTWPILLLLLDYWPLGRMKIARLKGDSPVFADTRTGTVPLMRLVAEKAPLLVLSLLATVATIVSQQAGAIMRLREVSLATRLEYTVADYAFYLEKAFWPTGLSVAYPHDKAPAAGSVAVALGVLVAISAAVAWAARRGRRYLAVGWLWYLGAFVPVIGLVPTGTQILADRFAYVPLAGLFLMVAWGGADLVARWRLSPATAALAAAALLLPCTVATSRQAHYWTNSETLFRRAMAVTENNATACDLLAAYLLQHGRPEEAGRYREKSRHFWQEALKIQPNDVGALSNLAMLLLDEKQYDEAARLLERALRLDPTCHAAHNTLAKVRERQGRIEEALEHLQEAYRLWPENVAVLNNLARVCQSQGKLDLAGEYWREILRLKPEDTGARNNLAAVYMQQGCLKEAADLLGESVQLNPEDTVVRNNLAMVMAMQGNYPGAVAEWSALLARKPRDTMAMNSLAWALATSPDASLRNGKKAVRLAEEMVDISDRGNPTELDTLAAAYAEAGQFPKAVTTALEALTLANRQGRTSLAADLQTRLEFYRKGSAFREVSPRADIGSAPPGR